MGLCAGVLPPCAGELREPHNQPSERNRLRRTSARADPRHTCTDAGTCELCPPPFLHRAGLTPAHHPSPDPQNPVCPNGVYMLKTDTCCSGGSNDEYASCDTAGGGWAPHMPESCDDTNGHFCCCTASKMASSAGCQRACAKSSGCVDRERKPLNGTGCYRPSPPPTPAPPLAPAPGGAWVLPLAVGGGAGLLLAIAFFWRRRARQWGHGKQQQQQQQQPWWTDYGGNGAEERESLGRALLSSRGARRSPSTSTDSSTQQQQWTISPDELLVDFSDVLGCGATSRVFRGQFLGAEVAVKEVALAFPSAQQAQQAQQQQQQQQQQGPGSGDALAKAAAAMKEEARVRRGCRNLERECALLSTLHHPNIVKFFGVCYVSVKPNSALVHIVTELCPMDLEHAMCAGGLRQVPSAPLPHGPRALQPTLPEAARPGCERPHEWLAFAKQIVAALSFIHSRGIIHRDLKPGNVLVQPTCSGESGGGGGGGGGGACCKLCDFGISKEAAAPTGSNAAGRELSHTGMQGTPAYMAPEVVVQHRGSYSSKVDVYSLGVLLWAMWTGAVPYDDVPGSVYQMLKAVEGGARPARAPPGPRGAVFVPRALWQLMEECWDVDPGTRPPMLLVAERLTEDILKD